ncbi:MAG: hypothetical protein Q9164_000276 [Protoblastenia rupestris]
MNVFGNAQKYTDEGFIRIILRARDAVQPEVPGRSSYREITNVTIIVEDTGRGISSEYLQHKLYKPFAQDDELAPGVGLGLSIVWNIVKQLQGTISVRSLSNKGTEVEINLPMDRPSKRRPSNPSATDYEDPFEKAVGHVLTLRKAAQNRTIMLHWPSNLQGSSIPGEHMILDCVESYLANWYNLRVTKFSKWSQVPPTALCVALESHKPESEQSSRQILLINGSFASKADKGHVSSQAKGCLHKPVGPYRLAHFLLSHMQVTVNGLSSSSLGYEDSSSCHALEGQSQSKALIRGSEEKHEAELIQEIRNLNIRSKSPRMVPLESTTDSGLSNPQNNGQDQQPAVLEAGTRNPAATSRLRLLAVDDNEINLQLLKRFLTKRKDDIVECAYDGSEAVTAVQIADQPYDVIFMDISMPVMDGFEATREIRKREAKTNAERRSFIVAVTGLGAERDRIEAAQSGFDEYLTKPLPFKKVGQILKERLSKKTTIQS